MKLFQEEHYRSQLLDEHWDEFVQMVMSKRPRPQSEAPEAQMELETIQDGCLKKVKDDHPMDYPLNGENE